MKLANFFTYAPKVLAQVVWSIIYFPLWWYGPGLLGCLRNLLNFLKNRERSVGFLVWLRNIFVPMYGQRSFSGRMVSFFMRLVQIIFRGAWMLMMLILALVGLIFWLAIPLVIIYAIVL